MRSPRNLGLPTRPGAPDKKDSVMPDKQLLHLVFGGELVRPDSDQFVDPAKVHIVGIFPNYDEAYKAWRGATGATIDDAHTRYFIVHLHRLLDPAKDGHGDHAH